MSRSIFDELRQLEDEQFSQVGNGPEAEASLAMESVTTNAAAASAGAMQLVRSGLSKLLPMEAFAQELQLIHSSLKKIVITDEVRAREVTDIVSKVKNLGKTFEDDREKQVKPLNDYVKSINARYKPLSEEIKGIESTGKAALNRYIRAKEEAARKKAEEEAARKKAEEEAAEARRIAEEDAARIRAANPQPPDAPPADEEPPLPAPPPEIPRSASKVSSYGGATASTRKIVKYEIVDFSKVPDAYLMVNDDAVKKAIAVGKREIPGLRIYEDTVVAIR